MTRSWRTLLAVIVSTTLGGWQASWAQIGQMEEDTAVLQKRIATLYKDDNHEGIVQAIDRYYRLHPATSNNFTFLLFRAHSAERLSRWEDAIGSYEHSLAFIRTMNNVEQRRYAWAWFQLGDLHARQDHLDAAVASVEEGLALEPQNVPQQIGLGELYRQLGRTNHVVAHYRELLNAPSLKEEERVVIQIKLDRLSRTRTADEPAPDAIPERLSAALSLKLVPINGMDEAIHLDDICLLLSSKFLMACEVLPTLNLNESIILDRPRNQYNGDRILEALQARLNPPKQNGEIVVAITGKDLYGENTNFVYSWQSPQRGLAVASSYRFSGSIGRAYEPDIIPTRRMGIQLISTTAKLLGFARATHPHCPTAYPNELSEFLMKSSRLCESEVTQRDALLRQLGGTSTPVDRTRQKEMERVYHTYHFR